MNEKERVSMKIPPGVHPLAIIGERAQWEEYLDAPVLPVEIHPEARIGALTVVDAGCVRPTKIGKSWLMCQVHVGHGTWIGDGVEVATGTVISGEVTVGNGVRFGVGVLVKPYVTIGANSRLGTGAVVISDIPAYECWAGNPARRLYAFCTECGVRQERVRVCDSCVWESALNEATSYQERVATYQRLDSSL